MIINILKYKKMNKKKFQTPPLSTILFWIFVISLGMSCQSKSEFEEAKPRLGNDYLPLNIGKFIEYEVDSIIYDPQNNNTIKIDTIHFVSRDVITDSLRDATGQKIYTIEHFERKDTTQLWQIKRVWSAAQLTDYITRTEENLRYLKIPQFFEEKTTWNAHIFINSDLEIKVADEVIQPFSKKWTFNIETFGKSETINRLNFENVLTIKGQTDPRIFNERRYTLEKYAKNIGLIYKELYILDSQNTDVNIAWERRAQRGYIVRSKVVKFN